MQRKSIRLFCLSLLLLATACDKDSLVKMSQARWTVVVIHENGQEIGRYVSFREPAVSSSGIVSYRTEDNETGRVYNPRGSTLVIPHRAGNNP